jgi:AcrR family transcriptional regulator
MPRVVKRPEERRNEFLDCAQALFFERGYDQTTVNDIIDRAGVSKGAFYHHFSSKEEMLEALAARLARESVALVGDVLDDSSLDALGRLNAFLARSRQLKVESAPKLRALFDVAFRPENFVLYHRINAAVVAVMTPVLARIIAQGVAEGVFDTPDPRATAEILLLLGTATHNAVARAIAASSNEELDKAIEELDRRVQLQGLAFDRILGVPDGSIRLVEPGFARAVLSAR